ncbi:hypothetical protein KFK09_026223 [Dendrobium nobile]|uniref:Cytochrome P450 n=1 Tax=Dendrobium nobile TaxID=94219 RepID=A0A8T3A6X4_DENNO|nr:hypothetical protein KFK09_026223 [Dendrobium nobile]
MLSFLIYFYLPYWKVRRIPGPPTKFLVGHLPLLAEYGPDIMKILAKNYGPIFRFHMGRQPLVMVADPELCREVGIKKFKQIKNRSSPTPTSGSAMHQEGLFLTRYLSDAISNLTLTSLYQPTHLSSLIPTMQSYVDLLLRNISNLEKKEEDIPFSELTLRMAIDIIGETAFGVHFGLSNEASFNQHIEERIDDEGDEEDEVSSFLKQHMRSINSLKMDLSSSFSTILGLVVPILQIPCRNILQLIQGTADYKVKQTNKKLCEKIDAIITKRSSERTKCSKDFLSVELFTHNYIRALTYEQLLAGTKTTAFKLAMTVYLISKFADVERKLLQEIDGFGSSHLTRFVTVSPLVAHSPPTPRESQEVEMRLVQGSSVLDLGALAKDPKQFPDPEVTKMTQKMKIIQMIKTFLDKAVVKVAVVVVALEEAEDVDEDVEDIKEI